MSYKRSSFPERTDQLLALIPEPTEGERQAADHVDEFGCRGCRVALWDAIEAADQADPLRPTWGHRATPPKESK